MSQQDRVKLRAPGLIAEPKTGFGEADEGSLTRAHQDPSREANKARLRNRLRYSQFVEKVFDVWMERFTRDVAWEPSFLDERDMETLGGRADGSRATRRAAANDEDVKDRTQGQRFKVT